MKNPRGAKLRLTTKHGLIITFLIIGTFVIVSFLLVAHVSKADFRLSARADFVGIATESEAIFKLPLSSWTLFNIAKLDTYTNSQQVIDGKTLAASNQTDEALFLIRIPPGAKILIRRYYDEGPRYQLVIAEKPFEVHLQLPKPSAVLGITDSAGSTYNENFTENITAQISPSIEPQLDFRVAVDELQLDPGFRISDIGFARQPENHVIKDRDDGQGFSVAFPSLLSGWISFLDIPDSMMHFARGSDVRFSGVNAAIDSLSFNRDGIEVNASGTVEDVQIRIGRGARSLMPTQFDKWKNDPATEIALGALSAVFGVAALLLAAIPVFSRTTK